MTNTLALINTSASRLFTHNLPAAARPSRSGSLAVPALAAAFALSSILGCEVTTRTTSRDAVGSTTAHAGAAAERIGAWGFDTAGMDTSVKPGDDFFAYTSGTWAKNTVIRPDRPSEGAFYKLRDLSEERCRAILENLRGEAGERGDRAKLAALYASFMDEATIERLDGAPIQPALDEIKRIANHKEFAAHMGRNTIGIGASAFNAGVGDDRKDPERYALSVRQSGLGLGNRELYLRDQFKPQRERYQQYIADMLTMAGSSDAAALAQKVMAFETSLAEAQWSIAESRQAEKTYNPKTLAELEQLAPGFEWRAFLESAGFAKADRAIVAQLTAFPPIAKLVTTTDLETLRAWSAFQTVDQAAPMLSKRFVDAHFDFRSKFLNSVPEQRARWKRGVEFVENAMGDALGREYVALYFPPSSKAQVESMVGNLRLALKARIDGLDWMSAETKAKAQEKLSKFGLKIGYPTKWRDYSTLEVRADDVVGNAMRAREHNAAFWAARLGQRVDRADFGMTPQTVNAYYSSTRNEIVFPAAILQPPFFDPNADSAINYGGIGAVIGHEITHGFDDQGRKSDGNGRLEDWWTSADAQQFEGRSKLLGDAYESIDFPQFGGLRLNGKQTMGENIADLGGVLLTSDAYTLSLNGKPAPVIDGFTGQQRVYLGWAQVWRTKTRDEALKQRIVSDVHSPGHIRAAAPLRHIEGWYQAFDVQPGQAGYLAPEARARIW